MDYKKDAIPAGIPIDFIYMHHDIEKIMNLFKDERFTIREDAVNAMYVQCIQHILNIVSLTVTHIGDSKGRMGSHNLLTSKHVLESKYVNPRIQAKCISAIDNMRKIFPLLSVYDDTPYLQNK